MTQEEKQLLLKDLSARLLYGVRICSVGENKILGITDISDPDLFLPKPYLRPMSSMTEEEKLEMWGKFYEKDGHGFPDGIEESMVFDYVDWLNEHHFDYRGLIEKGLALEAPEGMYKTE